MEPGRYEGVITDVAVKPSYDPGSRESPTAKLDGYFHVRLLRGLRPKRMEGEAGNPVEASRAAWEQREGRPAVVPIITHFVLDKGRKRYIVPGESSGLVELLDLAEHARFPDRDVRRWRASGYFTDRTLSLAVGLRAVVMVDWTRATRAMNRYGERFARGDVRAYSRVTALLSLRLADAEHVAAGAVSGAYEADFDPPAGVALAGGDIRAASHTTAVTVGAVGPAVTAEGLDDDEALKRLLRTMFGTGVDVEPSGACATCGGPLWRRLNRPPMMPGTPLCVTNRCRQHAAITSIETPPKSPMPGLAVSCDSTSRAVTQDR